MLRPLHVPITLPCMLLTLTFILRTHSLGISVLASRTVILFNFIRIEHLKVFCFVVSGQLGANLKLLYKSVGYINMYKVKELKYLGIIYVGKLTWKAQVAQNVTKDTKLFPPLRCFFFVDVAAGLGANLYVLREAFFRFQL